jgi:hypothetical protein
MIMMKNTESLDKMLRVVFGVCFISSIIIFAISSILDIQDRTPFIIGSICSFISAVSFLALFALRRRENSLYINPSKGHTKEGLVFLASTSNEMEAELIKNLLGTNGIKAVVKKEVPGSYGEGMDAYIKARFGQSTFGIASENIYVKAGDFDKAKRIIKNHLGKKQK